jgi:ABC-type phosphate transport system permease subunit
MRGFPVRVRPHQVREPGQLGAAVTVLVVPVIVVMLGAHAVRMPQKDDCSTSTTTDQWHLQKSGSAADGGAAAWPVGTARSGS